MEGSGIYPEEMVSLDRLAGEWWIYQLRRGHRYSTDDVLTAWCGVQARPEARRVLDLGAGVGSVGLLALLLLPPDARLTSVEVQPVSAGLLRCTVRHNGLDGRVEVLEADLRQPGLLEGRGPFDLVLANPPYLPACGATASPHPQRAAARLELKGDLQDFVRAAAGALAPEARFCFSFAAGDPRPACILEQAGLGLLSRREVVFREGADATIALHVCGIGPPGPQEEPILIRDEAGERTEEYRRIRRRMLIEA